METIVLLLAVISSDCGPNGGPGCEVVYPDSIVKVLEISRTFKQNVAAGDANYVKKSLILSGKLVRVVKSVDEDDKPIYVAELSPDGKPAPELPLAFQFKESQRDELRCLMAGDNVRIKGECVGIVTGEAPPAAPGAPPVAPAVLSEIQFKKCTVTR